MKTDLGKKIAKVLASMPSAMRNYARFVERLAESLENEEVWKKGLQVVQETETFCLSFVAAGMEASSELEEPTMDPALAREFGLSEPEEITEL